MPSQSIIVNGTDQVIIRDNVIVMDIKNLLTGWPTYEISFTPENPGPLVCNIHSDVFILLTLIQKLIIHLKDPVKMVPIEETTDSEAELLIPGKRKK